MQPGNRIDGVRVIRHEVGQDYTEATLWFGVGARDESLLSRGVTLGVDHDGACVFSRDGCRFMVGKADVRWVDRILAEIRRNVDPALVFAHSEHLSDIDELVLNSTR